MVPNYWFVILQRLLATLSAKAGYSLDNWSLVLTKPKALLDQRPKPESDKFGLNARTEDLRLNSQFCLSLQQGILTPYVCCFDKMIIGSSGCSAVLCLTWACCVMTLQIWTIRICSTVPQFRTLLLCIWGNVYKSLVVSSCFK